MEPILYELWEHHVFPAMSLRELALVALTCKKMRQFCRTFLVERVTERHLRALVARLPRDDGSSVDMGRLSARFHSASSVNYPRKFELCYSPIFGIMHMKQVAPIVHNRATRYDFEWKAFFWSDDYSSAYHRKSLCEAGPCLFGLHLFPILDHAIATGVKRFAFEAARQAYQEACSKEEEEEGCERPRKKRRLSLL